MDFSESNIASKAYLALGMVKQVKCPKYSWSSSILLCQTHYCVKQNTVSTLAFNVYLFNFSLLTYCGRLMIFSAFPFITTNAWINIFVFCFVHNVMFSSHCQYWCVCVGGRGCWQYFGMKHSKQPLYMLLIMTNKFCHLSKLDFQKNVLKNPNLPFLNMHEPQNTHIFIMN